MPMSSRPSATPDARGDEPAERRDAGCEAQVRRGVVDDGGSAARERARRRSRAATRRGRARCGRRGRRRLRAARARAPPAKASPQARCRRLSSACRWIPAPSSAAAEPTASTSASLAHCGAMIANCALSSGSPASSPHESRIVSTYASAACASPRVAARRPQIGRQRGDERLVAVVGQARAVAPVRRERHALPRLAVGAQRLLQLAGVGVLGRPFPAPDGKCMCRCDVTPRLDQQHVLAERPEIRIDRVEAEHRRHPRLERRCRAGRARAVPDPGIRAGRSRSPMPWWWALIRPGSTSMPAPPSSCDARVRAAQLVALPDFRDGAVADQHARRRGRGAASAEASRTSPRTRRSAMRHGTLAAGASVRHGLDRRRPRDRDLVGLHLTVLPHRGASRGVDGAPVRRSASPGCRSTCTPSTRPRASRAPSSMARYGDGYDRTASASVRGGGPGLCAASRRRLEHAPRAGAGGAGARGGPAPRLPRPRHGRLLGRGRRSLAAAARSRSSRASAGMSDEGIARALDDRAWAPAVDASTARAQAAGATGVPAFVIDWRVLVVGAQPREVLAAGDRAGARGRGRAAVEAVAAA